MFFVGLMYFVHSVILIRFHFTFHIVWVIGLFAISCFLLLPAVLEFYKHKTTVNPLKPQAASALVIKGVYKYSRNPMYLGMACLLAAWCVWLGNPINIVCLIGFIFYMNRFQILPEEKALEELFGEDFNQYKSQVRRWI